MQPSELCEVSAFMQVHDGHEGKRTHMQNLNKCRMNLYADTQKRRLLFVFDNKMLHVHFEPVNPTFMDRVTLGRAVQSASFFEFLSTAPVLTSHGEGVKAGILRTGACVSKMVLCIYLLSVYQRSEMRYV